MRQSDNPEQRSLADVLSVITELRGTVLGLEKRLDNPEGLLPKEFMRYMMRGSRSEKMAFEMRHMLDELYELAASEKPSNKSQKSEYENRIMSMRKMLDMMMHERW